MSILKRLNKILGKPKQTKKITKIVKNRCLYCHKCLPKKKTKPYSFCPGKNGMSHCKFNYYYGQRIPYYKSYYRNKVVALKNSQ